MICIKILKKALKKYLLKFNIIKKKILILTEWAVLF